MIHDTIATDYASVQEADVCIVGGGTAGLLLASQLQRRGKTVVIVEAGDFVSQPPQHDLHSCEQLGINYRGAEKGRAFGLGGTTALWGGQMIPLSAHDVTSRGLAFRAWPISYQELCDYYGKVPEALGLVGFPAGGSDETVAAAYPALATFGADFSLRLSGWLPFKSRNFAKVFLSELQSSQRCRILLNATATSFAMEPRRHPARASGLVIEDAMGLRSLVKAGQYVICAGALESTRLLLELDAKNDKLITAAGSPLGHFFADHLSIRCGTIECHAWHKFNLAVAPCFSGGVMRTPRLELSAQAQTHHNLPSAFAHFTFLTTGNTGFDLVRSILRRRQGERHSFAVSPRILATSVTDIFEMARYRFWYKKLWIPRSASLVLQIDIEQQPNLHSRVFLSNRADSAGRKPLGIDWRITQDDLRAVRKIVVLARAAWEKSALAELATLKLAPASALESFETLYDVYHPTGLIQMGDSPSTSVVNSDLRLWAVENISVSSTAVFPSAGSANPGLTHLALTLRLADRLNAISD